VFFSALWQATLHRDLTARQSHECAFEDKPHRSLKYGIETGMTVSPFAQHQTTLCVTVTAQAI
jgi:hypothetical protein